MGRQLKGATVGIIGYGVIGEYLAPAVASAIGMKVLATTRTRPSTSRASAQVTLRGPCWRRPISSAPPASPSRRGD